MKKYFVFDFFENPFGELIYIAHGKDDLKTFCKMYEEDTDGECRIKIATEK